MVALRGDGLLQACNRLGGAQPLPVGHVHDLRLRAPQAAENARCGHVPDSVLQHGARTSDRIFPMPRLQRYLPRLYADGDADCHRHIVCDGEGMHRARGQVNLVEVVLCTALGRGHSRKCNPTSRLRPTYRRLHACALRADCLPASAQILRLSRACGGSSLRRLDMLYDCFNKRDRPAELRHKRVLADAVVRF